MATGGTNTFPIADRWSYVWLILGGILGLFAFGQWTIPLASWFVTLFFLRFMHSHKTLRGYVILSLARMGLATILLGQLMPSSMFPAHVR